MKTELMADLLASEQTTSIKKDLIEAATRA